MRGASVFLVALLLAVPWSVLGTDSVGADPAAESAAGGEPHRDLVTPGPPGAAVPEETQRRFVAEVLQRMRSLGASGSASVEASVVPEEFRGLTPAEQATLSEAFLREALRQDTELARRIHPEGQRHTWADQEAGARAIVHGLLFDPASLQQLFLGGADGPARGAPEPVASRDPLTGEVLPDAAALEARLEASRTPAPPPLPALAAEDTLARLAAVAASGADISPEALATHPGLRRGRAGADVPLPTWPVEAAPAGPTLPVFVPLRAEDAPAKVDVRSPGWTVVDGTPQVAPLPEWRLEPAPQGTVPPGLPANEGPGGEEPALPPMVLRDAPPAAPAVAPTFLPPLEFPFPPPADGSTWSLGRLPAPEGLGLDLPSEVYLATTSALPALGVEATVVPPAAPAPLKAFAYRACGQLGSGPVRCVSQNLAVPFGVPVALDLDGSATTGLAGQDVLVLLAPADLPHLTVPPTRDQLTDTVGALQGGDPAGLQTPGLGVTLRIQPLPNAGAGLLQARELKAKVWVVYTVANTDVSARHVLRLGLDGTASGLPAASTLSFGIDSIPDLLDGRLLASATLGFDGPGDDLALFAAVDDLDGAQLPVNPTTVTVRMAPVSGLDLDLDARLDGSAFTGQVESVGSPAVTVSYATTRPGGETTAEVAIGALPSTVRVEFQRLADGTRLRYDASSTIGRLDAAFQHAAGTTEASGTLAIEGLPAQVETFIRPGAARGSVQYAASSVVPLVEATFSFLRAGVRTTGAASARDIPAQFAIAYDQEAIPHTIAYQASSRLGPVAFSVGSGPGNFAVDAAVDSLPPYLQVQFGPDFAEIDAREAPGAPPGSAALGALTLAYASDGQFLAGQPATEHLAVQQTAGGATRADLAYAGLEYLRADTRNGEVHVEVKNEASRFFPFVLDLPGALVEGAIDRVPRHVTVDIVGTRVAYDSFGERINQALLRFDDRMGFVASLEVRGIPGMVTVDLDAGSQRGALAYTASSTVPLVAATFARTAAGTTTTAEVRVEDVPARFTLGYDRTTVPMTLTYDASDSLGPVSLRLGSGPGKLAMQASVASLPPFVQVRLGPDFVEFDARTSSEAARGTGTVGPITLALATDGQLLANQPAQDHLSVHQPSPAVNRVDLRYTGLQYAKADTRNGEVHIEVQNNQPRMFLYQVDMPGALLTGSIEDIPAHVAIDVVGGTFTYDAFGQSIRRIALDYSDRAVPATTATIELRGVPARVSLALDLDDRQVVYTADRAVDGMDVAAAVPIPGAGTMVVDFAVTALPPFMHARFSPDFVEFDARSSAEAARGTGTVGTIALALGSDGQLLTGQPAQDHLSVQQATATDVRLDLRYTGLQYAKADTRDGEVHIEVQNSQPRRFLYQVDMPGALLTGSIEDIPARVAIDVVGETFTYDAFGQTIGRIALNLDDKAPNPVRASVEVRGIPSRIRLALDLDAEQVVYTAAGSVASVDVTASGPMNNGDTSAVRLGLTALPPFVQVRFSQDFIEFDARTSATAAPGTGTLGAIRLSLASDGQLLAGQPTTDHLAVQQQGSVTRLDVVYSGLQYAKADTRNGEMHLEVKNSAPRYFPFTVDMAGARITGAVADVPSRMTVDVTGTRIAYNSFGQVIGQVLLNLDDRAGLVASLDVRGIPSLVTVDLDVGVQRGNIAYTTSGVVPLVAATFARTGANGITTSGQASVRDIPARFTVSFDRISSPLTMTYDASSSLGPVAVSLGHGPGQFALQASLASLPPFVQVRSLGDFFEFDARSSPTAAPGTGAVGAMTLAAASDGQFLTGQPVQDHASVQQPGPNVIRADLKYTGLQYLKADTRNDETHIEVRNSAPRMFVYKVDLPGAFLNGSIENIPARVAIDVVGERTTYNAFGQTIGRIVTHLNNKDALGTMASIEIRGIPANLTLLMDLDAQRLQYTAGSPVGGLDVVASVPVLGFGMFAIDLGLTSLPASWNVTFGNGTFVYDSPTGVGSIGLTVHNYAPGALTCGVVSTVPLVYVPNHLCATLDVPARRYGIEFALVDVKHVEYHKVGSSTVLDLGVGGGQRFVANLAVVLNSTFQAKLTADIASLPATLHLETGPELHYSASANFDLALDATIGDPAAFSAVPTPPAYALGAAIRDGQVGAAKAIKAKVRFTGAPTSLEFDHTESRGMGSTLKATTLDAKKWRPASTGLVLDVDLRSFLGDRLLAYAFVDNLVPFVGATQDLRFQLKETKPVFGGGAPTTSTSWSTTSDIGPVTARAIFGTDQVYLNLSKVPRAMNFSANLVKNDSVVAYDASAAIASLYVGFAVNSVPQSTFDGALELTDIPARWTMTIGRNAVGATLDYSASASTLDAEVVLGATLFDGDIRARVTAAFSNLGATTTAKVIPGALVEKMVPNTDTTDPCDEKPEQKREKDGLEIKSVPDTDFFYVTVSAEVDHEMRGGGTKCFQFIIEWRLSWGYILGISGEVRQLRTQITDLVLLHLKPGYPTKVTGSYGTFDFGWNDITMSISVNAIATFDGCTAIGCARVFTVDPGQLTRSGPINLWFHRANNQLDDVFAGTFRACIGGVGATATGDVEIKPSPVGQQRNGFVTYGTRSTHPEANGKWYIVPDLDRNGESLLPTWAGGLLTYGLADRVDRGFNHHLSLNFRC